MKTALISLLMLFLTYSCSKSKKISDLSTNEIKFVIGEKVKITCGRLKNSTGSITSLLLVRSPFGLDYKLYYQVRLSNSKTLREVNQLSNCLISL